MMKTSRNAALVLAPLALVTSQAQAAAVDVSAIVTDIAAQSVPIALIGMAVLLIFVALKAFKWIRRSL